MCKHCYDAACVDVCPVPGCITRDPKSGHSIVLDERLCVGCLYCVFSCPFSVPRYEPERRIASKCSRCFDRIAHMPSGAYKSQVPYCVAACPTGALRFGDDADIKDIANNRLHNLQTKQGKRDANIYGRDTLGGLGVFYILETLNERDYGLPRYPRMPATVRTWQGLWKPLTFIIAGVSLLFWLLHYAIIGPVGVRVVEEPEEEERELTEEEYDRMIRAKRRAGKQKRDMPKGYRPRRKGPKKKGKGKAPARRSRLPGRKAKEEEEDF
jgi:formate dehydrogenase iron-sulfur subunit